MSDAVFVTVQAPLGPAALCRVNRDGSLSFIPPDEGNADRRAFAARGAAASQIPRDRLPAVARAVRDAAPGGVRAAFDAAIVAVPVAER